MKLNWFTKVDFDNVYTLVGLGHPVYGELDMCVAYSQEKYWPTIVFNLLHFSFGLIFGCQIVYESCHAIIQTDCIPLHSLQSAYESLGYSTLLPGCNIAS